MVAAFFTACQTDMVAQGVKQRRADVECKVISLSIDVDGRRMGSVRVRCYRSHTRRRLTDMVDTIEVARKFRRLHPDVCLSYLVDCIPRPPISLHCITRSPEAQMDLRELFLTPIGDAKFRQHEILCLPEAWPKAS